MQCASTKKVVKSCWDLLSSTPLHKIVVKLTQISDEECHVCLYDGPLNVLLIPVWELTYNNNNCLKSIIQ